MFRILHNYPGRRYARPLRPCRCDSELAWWSQGSRIVRRSGATQTRRKHDLSVVFIAAQTPQGFRAYHN